MDIDTTKCVGCGNCHIICTMGAISLDADGRSVVNQDECVECSTCYRVLKNEEYWVWFVRAIRKALSFFHLGHLADTDLCPTGALTPPRADLAPEPPCPIQQSLRCPSGNRRPRPGDR